MSLNKNSKIFLAGHNGMVGSSIFRLLKKKNYKKIYTKNTNEEYFDKFRNKEKLKTKAEQILEKDGKD